MKNNLLLIGCGGHCTSVLDSILNCNRFYKIGILDMPNKVGTKLLGIKVIGTNDDFQKFYNAGYTHAFVTIGNNLARKNLLEKLKTMGFIIPNIIDSSAIVSKYTTLGSGIFIGKGAIVNSNCTIEDGVIINTGSVIEHDCTVKKYSHISPSATLCGGVEISNLCHIGANSVVRQLIKIGENTTIGMGSVVVKNITNNKLAYGNPCKVIKEVN